MTLTPEAGEDKRKFWKADGWRPEPEVSAVGSISQLIPLAINPFYVRKLQDKVRELEAKLLESPDLNNAYVKVVMERDEARDYARAMKCFVAEWRLHHGGCADCRKAYNALPPELKRAIEQPSINDRAQAEKQD